MTPLSYYSTVHFMQKTNEERLKSPGCQSDRCHVLARIACRIAVLEGLAEGRSPYLTGEDIAVFGPRYDTSTRPLAEEDIREEMFDQKLLLEAVVDYCNGGSEIRTNEMLVIGKMALRIPGATSAICPGEVNLRQKRHPK